MKKNFAFISRPEKMQVSTNCTSEVYLRRKPHFYKCLFHIMDYPKIRLLKWQALKKVMLKNFYAIRRKRYLMK